jgi:hypothetical protein
MLLRIQREPWQPEADVFLALAEADRRAWPHKLLGGSDGERYLLMWMEPERNERSAWRQLGRTRAHTGRSVALEAQSTLDLAQRRRCTLQNDRRPPSVARSILLPCALLPQIRHVQCVRVEDEAAPGSAYHGDGLVVAADKGILKPRQPAVLQAGGRCGVGAFACGLRARTPEPQHLLRSCLLANERYIWLCDPRAMRVGMPCSLTS